MKPALAILVRANRSDVLERELGLLAKVEVHRPDHGEFEHVYLIAVGHRQLPQARSTMFDWANAHWPLKVAAKVLAYAPKELANASPDTDLGLLSDYLRSVFLAKIIERPNYMQLKVLWRDDWLGASTVVAGLTATTNNVDWWLPTRSAASLAKLPRIPSGFRFRDLWRSPAHSAATSSIVGVSPAADALRHALRAAAIFPQPILLIGETGTGKELCAVALHELSGRHGRFVPVNCALLDGQLAESELFGHIAGAFTDAKTPRDGRIREARGGSFFLDEMMSMPLTVQAKLLRATNDVDQAIVHVTPMGAKADERDEVDVRVISAVQANIAADKTFRSDLYQRLSWLEITVPPLRDRGADAAIIARLEFERFLTAKDHRTITVNTEIYAALCDPTFHGWPGNIRELRKVIFRAWHDGIMSDAKEITLRHLEKARGPSVMRLPDVGNDLRAAVDRFIVDSAADALRRSPGNKTAAARSLGFATGQELTNYADGSRKSLAKRGAGNA